MFQHTIQCWVIDTGRDHVRKIGFSIFFIFIVLAGLHFFSTAPSTVGERFRDDADSVRLEHLVYWSGLIEEYHAKTGHYPMQDWIQPGEDIRLVRILTAAQRDYVTKISDQYIAAADTNPEGLLPEAGMKDFIGTLEGELKRPIEEKYDIQQVPTVSPIGYYYFATRDGYVLWTTCIRCGVTPVSTLLMDGHTPTVNITSPEMVDKVTKAKTRDDMLADPVFRKLASIPYFKEGFVRALERKHVHDSKR